MYSYNIDTHAFLPTATTATRKRVHEAVSSVPPSSSSTFRVHLDSVRCAELIADHHRENIFNERRARCTAANEKKKMPVLIPEFNTCDYMCNDNNNNNGGSLHVAARKMIIIMENRVFSSLFLVSSCIRCDAIRMNMTKKETGMHSEHGYELNVKSICRCQE